MQGIYDPKEIEDKSSGKTEKLVAVIIML